LGARAFVSDGRGETDIVIDASTNALGSYAAFKQLDASAMVMGDLVLLAGCGKTPTPAEVGSSGRMG